MTDVAVSTTSTAVSWMWSALALSDQVAAADQSAFRDDVAALPEVQALADARDQVQMVCVDGWPKYGMGCGKPLRNRHQ